MGAEQFDDSINESELSLLSREDLVMRYRRSLFYISRLEKDLVKMSKNVVLSAVNEQNDPEGYFKILLMHPDTPEDKFEELLKRNFRVLSLKNHPDKGGDAGIFARLKEAYHFLSDRENRENYRKASVVYAVNCCYLIMPWKDYSFPHIDSIYVLSLLNQ